MAVVVLLFLILGLTGHSTATWCVCKSGVSDPVLQKALDYACGAGADCNPIHQNGVCFNPNTVKAHCDYAVNSYFQKKGQAQGSCDFAGAATISTSDPSIAGCAFPSTASATGTPTTPGTTTPVSGNTPGTTTPVSGNTPGTTTPSTTGTTPTSTTTTPYTTSPSSGVLGGVGNAGVGPSGVNTDYSDGGLCM
ncbi:plasmodesmata callose-binding protein 3 [Melia azedarach]|uniref:Plasmodesmata callose-binding protein 3 n=1 Tax=Melia azedarach TaxID=155640 RepID=A0ACC1XSA0_MELAZ|nr:plasmodesmata callose-binding protein 3 [Melia azedarach]